jgi:hypothetical protein
VAACCTIALPGFALAALRRHNAGQNERRLRWGGGYPDQGFMLTGINGDPWKRASIATLF